MTAAEQELKLGELTAEINDLRQSVAATRQSLDIVTARRDKLVKEQEEVKATAKAEVERIAAENITVKNALAAANAQLFSLKANMRDLSSQHQKEQVRRIQLEHERTTIEGDGGKGKT